MKIVHSPSEELDIALGQSASDGVGVLLVHGLNGTKWDMEELKEFLVSQNLQTVNMLLPGHGTDVRDMIPIGWTEWAQAVRDQLQQLKRQYRQVFLVGHSLGGALCLHTAVHEEVDGVVAMCPPLSMYRWMLPAVRLAKRFAPILPTLRKDICDPVARRHCTEQTYRWTPMAPIVSMLEYLPHFARELPTLTVPVMIMRALHDHVVPARDGQAIYELLGSQDKELITLYRSYHMIMQDYEHQQVFSKVLSFIQRLTR